MADPAEPLLSLNPEFIRRISDDPLGWPTRDNFVAFFRDQKNRRGSVEHLWPKLKQGKAVPAEIVAGLVEYVRERKKWHDVTVENSAHATPFAGPDEAIDVLSDFKSLVNGLTEQFADDDDMYLHHPVQEPLFVARTIMLGVGRKTARHDDAIDEEACVARAELAMGYPLGDYATWLANLWKTSSRTVMFATHRPSKRGASSATRVGINVMLPLKKETFEKVCAGKVREVDLSAADLIHPTEHLYVHSITEIPGHEDLSFRHITAAQARCLMYQAAYFTRDVKLSRVHVATIVTNPTNERRLERQGYRKNGSLLGGTDKPLVILHRPSVLPSLNDRVQAT